MLKKGKRKVQGELQSQVAANPWHQEEESLSGSNYPYLERVLIVPKMFKPLKLECI